MSTRAARPVKQAEPSPLDPIQPALDWLAVNWWWLLLLIIVAGVLFYGIRWAKRRHDEIQKLWVFTLFFLTKRQMMIPLVISLARKDKLIDKKTQAKLMEIRERCRDVSFKKSPKARLEIETEVSEILFSYFSKLEKNNQIKTNTKLSKVVQDLEFIDAKLVQMQKVYNLEAAKWNQKLRFPGLKAFLKPFGVKSFESFS